METEQIKKTDDLQKSDKTNNSKNVLIIAISLILIILVAIVVVVTWNNRQDDTSTEVDTTSEEVEVTAPAEDSVPTQVEDENLRIAPEIAPEPPSLPTPSPENDANTQEVVPTDPMMDENLIDG